MQITALSTIIAAQQARGSAPAKPPVEIKKPATPQPSAISDFAPLAFGQQAAPEAALPVAGTTPANLANAPLGSQIDIRI